MCGHPEPATGRPHVPWTARALDTEGREQELAANFLAAVQLAAVVTHWL